RHAPPDDRAGTAHRWQADADRPPTTTRRLVPNVWHTDARCHAPMDLPQGVCRYRLRGTAWTGNTRCDAVGTMQRHPCVLITSSASHGRLMTGAPSTSEAQKHSLSPPMTPTWQCCIRG